MNNVSWGSKGYTTAREPLKQYISLYALYECTYSTCIDFWYYFLLNPAYILICTSIYVYRYVYIEHGNMLYVDNTPFSLCRRKNVCIFLKRYCNILVFVYTLCSIFQRNLKLKKTLDGNGIMASHRIHFWWKIVNDTYA